MHLICVGADDSQFQTLTNHLTAARSAGMRIERCESASRARELIEDRDQVLFLLGPDSLQVCQEVYRVLEEPPGKQVSLTLVLWRQVDLGKTPLSDRQILPRDGKQIAGRRDADKIWADLAQHLREGGGRLIDIREAGPRNELFEEVLQVCRLGEQKQIPMGEVLRRRGAPPFPAYAEVRYPPRSIRLPYLVTASRQPLTKELLQQLFDIVIAPYKRDNQYIRAQLVHTSIATPDLEDQAHELSIELSPLLTYRHNLIDLRPCQQHQREMLAADPRYRREHYVQQHMEYRYGKTPSTANAALPQVRSWLREPGGLFLFILGDSGTGKSFLLRELAQDLSVPNAPLTPLLINLRGLDKRSKLDELISQHLVQAGHRMFNLDAFHHMLEQGLIVLLFDGYDELALRVSYERAAEHLDEIMKAARGRAKVVVTSRTQHFKSDEQVRQALARGLQLQGFSYRLLRLLPFTQDQIHVFLRKAISDQRDHRERLALWVKALLEVDGLMELAANPRMLSFLISLDAERVRQAEGLNRARLYELLITDWIKDQEDRASESQDAGLGIQHLWEAVDLLALRLWGQSSVTLEELPAEVRKVIAGMVQAPELDIAVQQVGSGTLLCRDEVGRFSFLHASLLDWLVARIAVREFAAGHGAGTTLVQREMSGQMIDFFIELAGPDRAVAWAEGIVRRGGSQAERANALHVLRRRGVAVREPVRMEGQDLRGHDLSGQDLSRGHFARADLRDARLVGTDLRLAFLRDALLDGADLRGADLTGARLAGASLRRARLIGARIDAGALSCCCTEGAALPGARRPLPQTAPGCQIESLALARGFLATGCSDGRLLLWDPETGVLLRSIGTGRSPVLSVAFCPDGSQLAVACEDTQVALRDMRHGGERRLRWHRDTVHCVAFGRDGDVLATASEDRSINLWSMSAGGQPRTLVGHKSGVFCLAFDRGGTMLASGSRDGSVLVWPLRPGPGHRVLTAHQDPVLALDFHPDGELLASGSADCTVSLWDTRSWQLRKVLRGQGGAVRGLAFSPSGTHLAVAAADGQVTIWGGAGELPVTLPGHCDRVRGVAFSSDGRLLFSASNDGTVRLWDVSGVECRGVLFPCPDGWVAFRPDGAYKSDGDVSGRFWHMIGECRFEPGELDAHLPIRLPTGSSLIASSVP